MYVLKLALLITATSAILTSAAYTVYLPVFANDGVSAAAIGYGREVALPAGHWVAVTCEDGSAPTVQADGASVLVKCGE